MVENRDGSGQNKLSNIENSHPQLPLRSNFINPGIKVVGLVVIGVSPISSGGVDPGRPIDDLLVPNELSLCLWIVSLLV